MMKFVLMGIIALILLKAGWNKFEKWQLGRQKEESAQVNQGWFDHFWDKMDLSQTMPGKAIDAALGTGWSNWVLWGLIVIAIYYFVLRHFLPGAKGAKSSVNWTGIIAWALFLGVTAGVTVWYLNKDSSSTAEVDLTKVGVDEPVLRQLSSLSSTVDVVVGRHNGGDGRTNYWICVKVVGPTWFSTHPEAPKEPVEFINPTHVGSEHEVRLTMKTQEFLVSNGAAEAKPMLMFYKVESTLGVPGKCQR